MWLLTSGPTREYLDDVRFLSNGSSGRMGHEIARAAQERGHEVTLVQGPVALEAPPGVRVVDVVSAREMLEAGLEVLRRYEAELEVLIGVAAVCDWRPRERAVGKPAKNDASRTLELVPNPDVLATLAAERAQGLAVGFALQSFADENAFDAALAAARRKIERKSLDAIVLNEVAAMEASAARAWWVDRAEGSEPTELGSSNGATKRELAVSIVRACEARRRQMPAS